MDSIGYGSDLAFVMAIVVGLVNFATGHAYHRQITKNDSNYNEIGKTHEIFLPKS
jgi:hypothetical protein